MKLLTKSIGTAILLSAFLFTITSFTNTEILSSNPEVNMGFIPGTWVYKSYKDGLYIYGRNSDFKSNKPGYHFLASGKMTKRMDPDWCARVAGPYTNIIGSWEEIEPEVIKTTYQCPISDKPSHNKYKVIELSHKKLTLKALPRK